jgi:RNA polymerase sigma-70 factor (ECF subfamily)
LSTIYEIKDFIKFYDENEPFVRKSLHYIIKNEDKISDIVQEVFVKVWKKSDKFQQKSNVKTWLYRITVNCAYDHLRKEKKQKL